MQRPLRALLYAVGVISALAALGCTGSEVAPAKVAAPPSTRPRAPGPRVSSELGDIDEDATKRTFERLGPGVMACYSAGLDRLAYLAGDVNVSLRVGADGRLRWVFFEQSTLGDRITEACMLKVLKDAHWPRPEGGEAEVHHTLGFDPPPDVKLPKLWTAATAAAAVALSNGELTACKRHGAGPFSVTVYVGEDGGAGRVLSAGAAAPNAVSAADLDCLLGVVQRMKLQSPGDSPAKVSFSL